MPTYAYRCPNGHLTEEVCKSKDAPEWTGCNDCEQRATRAYTAPMVPLMGGQTRTRRRNPGDDLPVTAR